MANDKTGGAGAKGSIPRHVAIIMDGNGRWAAERGEARIRGHAAGAEAVRRMVRRFRELGLPYLTLYAFSTENWRRPRREVEALMRLLGRFLRSELPGLAENNVRLAAIGDLSRLASGLRKNLLRAIDATAGNDGLVLTLALNYGGRDELVRAARAVARRCLAGRLRVEEVDERALADELDSRGVPDPDLVIRTAGEKRLSNFLLWQTAYAEFYATDRLWPDFAAGDLDQALAEYGRRVRKFGAVTT